MDDHQHDQRHTAAHILIQALIRLWPDTKPGVGPALEEGFYHDFTSSHQVSVEDFPAIEKEIRKIIAEKLAIVGEKKPIDEGIQWLIEKKYTHTQELAEKLKTEGETEISFYGQGEFTNMCRGGHLDNTADVGVIKLTKVAGAYWLGDQSRHMMQRIYGVVFDTTEQLDAYKHMLEEAKRRDHRKLGVDLDLFVFSDLVGSGLPLWTPRGTIVRNLLDEFVWELRRARGYERVEIPHITKKDLYETSGHWDKFKDELFRITTREGHEFAMKPMNCPHHTQIYARKPWSYRELPQRYANTTVCYRDEQSGELNGLSRVRAFAQDDAHVFCRMADVKSEFIKIWDIIHEFYSAFGIELQVRFSRHDPSTPEKYLGGAERWAAAESVLGEILDEKNVHAIDGVGEAAFYGPKLDFLGKDSLGREWQVATIQLDMNMPERFDLTCINEQGEKERIVMIHAAIMGSIERFMATMLEHTAGLLPVWLSPVQISILPVGSQHVTPAEALAMQFRDAGIRISIDTSDATVGKKIRAASKQKIPYQLVFGDQEVSSGILAIRTRGSNETINMSVESFIEQVKTECKTRQ